MNFLKILHTQNKFPLHKFIDLQNSDSKLCSNVYLEKNYKLYFCYNDKFMLTIYN